LKFATINPAKAMRIEKITGKIQEGLSEKMIVAINIKDFSC
jgi:N-acetylglucosamine-6-phosphate deacetylase